MSRRAILQIGTEKTGSTTLQHFLAANRAGLAASAGTSIPSSAALQTTPVSPHMRLAPAKCDDIREPFGGRMNPRSSGMRARLRSAAAAELASERRHGDLLFRALP